MYTFKHVHYYYFEKQIITIIQYVRTPARRALPLALLHMRMPLARPCTPAAARRPTSHHAAPRALLDHTTQPVKNASIIILKMALFKIPFISTRQTERTRARTHKPRPPIGCSRRALSGVAKKTQETVETSKPGGCRSAAYLPGEVANMFLDDGELADVRACCWLRRGDAMCVGASQLQ